MSRSEEPRRSRQATVGVAVRAGVLATVSMDTVMVAAGIIGRQALSTRRLSPGMIGRWAGDLLLGDWSRQDMLARPPRRGEVVLGLLTHYATGIALTGAFLVIPRAGAPTLVGATGYGIATSALPLLVMFPSMGYGWLGRRSGEAARLTRIMLLGHTAFGVGIGLWSRRLGRDPKRPMCPTRPGTGHHPVGT